MVAKIKTGGAISLALPFGGELVTIAVVGVGVGEAAVGVATTVTGITYAAKAIHSGEKAYDIYQALKGAGNTGNFDGPKLSFNESQFGKKIGKHASDFGLDPSDPSSRQFIRDKITSRVDSPDEVRCNLWMGQGSLGTTGAEGYVNMYIQGNSAVITKLNGEFITILKDYTINSRVVEAVSIWP